MKMGLIPISKVRKNGTYENGTYPHFRVAFVAFVPAATLQKQPPSCERLLRWVGQQLNATLIVVSSTIDVRADRLSDRLIR